MEKQDDVQNHVKKHILNKFNSSHSSSSIYRKITNVFQNLNALKPRGDSEELRVN